MTHRKSEDDERVSRESLAPVPWGSSVCSSSNFVPETPPGGRGGAEDPGEPGTPCWKDAPEEEEEVGNKGGKEEEESGRHWVRKPGG